MLGGEKKKEAKTASTIFSFYGLILFQAFLIHNTNTLYLFEFRGRLKQRDENESGPMVLKTS